MNLINELVEHAVFGTGRVISQNDRRITIQFSKETGVRHFIYPDAFDKYLNMCNPAAAQDVLADLTVKAEQIQAQLKTKDASELRVFEKVASAARNRKSAAKVKQPKAKINKKFQG